MPGFPLAAIGAGLGMWAKDYRAQQEAAQRQQIQNLYMQQARRAQIAKELEGLALSSGGIPGFGDTAGGGISPVGGGGLPGSPSMPASPGPPAAAVPQAVSSPQNPLYSGGQYQPDLDRPTRGQQSLPQVGGYAAPGSDDTYNLDDPPTQGGTPPLASGSPEPGVTIGNDIAGQRPTNTPTAAGPSQAAPEPVAETKDGRLIFDVPQMGRMDLSTLFRHVDPQAIASKIKQLRPDAPPDAIAMATESLYKMANSGSKSQQLETMALLRYLQATRSQDIRVSEGAANRDVRVRGQDITSTDRAAGRGTTERGQDIRAGESQANRQQRGEQFGQRQSDIRAREALRRGDAQTRAQLGTLEKQMADIRSRMNLINTGPSPSSPQNKAALDAYNKQLDALEKQRDVVADKVLGRAVTPTE